MTVFLAWAADRFPDDLVGEVPGGGPWREVRRVDDRVLLVDSDETLSRVYHELKWALGGPAALLVTACEAAPKARGLPPGTTSWLRARAALRPGG